MPSEQILWRCTRCGWESRFPSDLERVYCESCEGVLGYPDRPDSERAWCVRIMPEHPVVSRDQPIHADANPSGVVYLCPVGLERYQLPNSGPIPGYLCEYLARNIQMVREDTVFYADIYPTGDLWRCERCQTLHMFPSNAGDYWVCDHCDDHPRLQLAASRSGTPVTITYTTVTSTSAASFVPLDAMAPVEPASPIVCDPDGTEWARVKCLRCGTRDRMILERGPDDTLDVRGAYCVACDRSGRRARVEVCRD